MTRTRRRVIESPDINLEGLEKRYSEGEQYYEIPYNAIGSVRYRTESITDVVTPSFKKRQALGEIFNNPYTKTSVTSIDSPASSETYSYTSSEHLGDMFVSSDKTGTHTAEESFSSKWIYYSPDEWVDIELPISVDYMKDLAVTQAYANIDASKAKLLATLGESKQTVSFIADKFREAIKVFKAAKKLDFKRARLGMRSLSNLNLKRLRKLKLDMAKKIVSQKAGAYAGRYMELRYALRPLVYDILQITDAFSGADVFKDRTTFRGFQTATERNVIGDTRLLRLPRDTARRFGERRVYGSKVQERTVKVSAGVLTSVKEVSPLVLWGIDQPIDALWEVFPLSFVADWFFNIGQTIASWTPALGIEELASWVTVRDVRTHTVMATRTEIDYYYKNIPQSRMSKRFSVNGAYMTYERSTVTRTINPNRRVIPHFRMRLDPLKLLDLSIIIKQLCSK